MSKILDIKDFSIVYNTQDGVSHSLNHVTLSLEESKTLGLVGETGAGKTTLAKGIMRLLPSPAGQVVSGTVYYQGKDMYKLSKEEMRQIHGREISMVFQDPMTSLNPVLTVGDQIAEAITAHEHMSKEKGLRAAEEMLELVGIPRERANEYPHQFSGGMKQRVVIAIALACNPKVLIADEPTSALDVTIQAQILEMMKGLQTKFKTAMLLITHDLGVVAQNCDYVAVIYSGEIVEYGTVYEIFDNMRHPYSLGLFHSIPSLTHDVNRLTPIDGMMPDPIDLPEGCFFSPRCPFAQEKCKKMHPELSPTGESHLIRCFFPHKFSMRGNCHD